MILKWWGVTWARPMERKLHFLRSYFLLFLTRWWQIIKQFMVSHILIIRLTAYHSVCKTRNMVVVKIKDVSFSFCCGCKLLLSLSVRLFCFLGPFNFCNGLTIKATFSASRKGVLAVWLQAFSSHLSTTSSPSAVYSTSGGYGVFSSCRYMRRETGDIHLRKEEQLKGIMGKNLQEQVILHAGSKALIASEHEGSLFSSMLKSPIESGRPSSMVVKKPKAVIPPHIVAEAISSLHGLDLRWSGPITPSEMQYVEQYVLAKYPQYYNGLIEDDDKNNLYSLCIPEESPETPDDKRKSPRGLRESTSPSFGSSHPDLDRTQLEPSRLLDILNKKSTFPGTFISIPEIQAQNRVLKHCGLREDDYLVLFTPSCKDAMMLVGESYPFFRYNVYMTIIEEEVDCVREFASYKDAKVIAAPESWLDLRIKGSQLSQYFRRKCKYSPKGLFSYPADVRGTRYSMHWISEAHRNSWHVLLDASGLLVGKDPLNLALHRPDFVLCTLENTHNHPSKVTCLLVRRHSFDTSSPS